MAFFTDEYLNFFKELAANNHRDWFHANKKRYETYVKKPFEEFTQVVIARIAEVDPAIQRDAKKSIFRINRDIRFSKDKSPYKLNRSAAISEGKKSEWHLPGFYFEFNPENIRFYMGMHSPAPAQVQEIRSHIVNHKSNYQKVVGDKKFISHYGEVRGDEHKRLPKEFRDAAEELPILFKKSYYIFGKGDAEAILRDDLVDVVMNFYEAGRPWNLFLRSAIGI